MPKEGDKWRVAKGDCLWNIASSVYGNGRRWQEIANANGIPTSNPIIYPNQLFILPGISAGTSSPSATPTPPPTVKKVNIEWFCLSAGTERTMEARWSWSGEQRFWIKWEYYDVNGNKWVKSETQNYATTTGETPQAQCDLGTEAKRCRISIRPVKNEQDEQGNQKFQDNTEWEVREYDFANNPPGLPPSPSFEIDSNNKLTVTINNISTEINATQIEIAIYQDDTYKYRTAKVNIVSDARFAKYETTVDAGHFYKVRIRAVRGSIAGGWTDFTDNDQAVPVAPRRITVLRPQQISPQMSEQLAVLIEWTEEKTAKQYEVQWAAKTDKDINPFDVPGNIHSQITEEGKGPRLIVEDVTSGTEYFFRVRSINDKGVSTTFTPVKSVILGTKPSAPTTWSNVSNAVIGEDLNLYWTHNSTDGSYERIARLHITVIDSKHPELVPTEYTKTINNTKPEDQKDSNSVYTINTNDQEWSIVKDGFIIKWKVQTAGIGSDFSEWSVEREVNVYAKPSLTLDITNQNGGSITEVNSFPFHFSILARPTTQTPISYYIEVVANSGYTTMDDIGNLKIVNPGDKIYQKYYDPDDNAWRFIIEMSPTNIDLQNNISYTVNAVVAMDSGLTASASQSFNVYFNDLYYDVFADVIINNETLSASIHPYCYEYDEDGNKSLTQNVKLAVYRREYDGSFTEIATNINNEIGLYVTDPHPSLDYARYRIVAKTNDTGAISYGDIKAVRVNEPSIVIQWAEQWSDFQVDDEGTGNVEPPWEGSMIKIPYNVDVTENKKPDASLINYVGRKHPVSYYGTHTNETASWSCVIPAEDKELLYGLRRLAAYAGDVYVREPSGVGYWANITVSLSQKHLDVTIPVSFDITRVEGGI